MKHLEKIKYLPLAMLVLVYVVHSIEGFMGAPAFFEIVEVLGLSSFVTALLVHFVGPLDMAVAVLLICKNKIAPALPWSYLYVWAALWPWVPRTLEWYGGLESSYGESAFITGVAFVAYLVHRKSSRQ